MRERQDTARTHAAYTRKGPPARVGAKARADLKTEKHSLRPAAPAAI